MFPFLSAKVILASCAVIGVLTLIVGTYAVGRYDGANAVALKASEGVRAMERELNGKAAELNYRLTELQTKNRVLEGKLDREADNDPYIGNDALGSDSLRRVERAFDAARDIAAGFNGAMPRRLTPR